MLTVMITGLLTALALIVAIGPQSVWLLRQGLRRDRIIVAVLCCIAGDILLIGLGTLGVDIILDHAPWLLDVIRWVGVAYLLWFAARSFRSAFTYTRSLASTVRVEMTSDDADSGSPDQSVSSGYGTAAEGPDRLSTATAALPRVTVTKVSTVAATGLTLSVLNPHAWVDSLVVLGTMANSFGADKWWFAAGAMLASIVWLAALACGSAALSRLMSRRRTWQIIDISVGITMTVVAGVLAFSGF